MSFESRENMGEELDSLRATIDDQHIYENNSTTTNPRSPHRRKRFLSYPRYVELMVTADAKMVRHHGRNLEHYILTIMSVVSKIMFLKIIFCVDVEDLKFVFSILQLAHVRFWVIIVDIYGYAYCFYVLTKMSMFCLPLLVS